MLHHESYRSDTAHRVTVASEPQTVQQIQQDSDLDYSAEANTLLRGVATEDLSPNKAAVVRQLLALWLQEAKSQQV